MNNPNQLLQSLLVAKMNSEYGLDTVNISLLPADQGGVGKKPFPLVISPRWDSSKGFWVKWCNANRTWLDQMLLQYGAILVRGFDLVTPADMQQAVQAYNPHLSNTYRGTSPRKVIDGTEYIFSAAEVPVTYPIAQHIEMAFLECPPRQLFFGCIKQSDTAGGETALADFRKVFQDLPHELKQKLVDKGLRYERTHNKVGSRFTYDVSDMLGWPMMFGTNDKAQVERLCAKEGTPVMWRGDTFVSITHSDAFQLHPVTNEPVWFNHIQVFHWTTFPAELLFAFQRTHDIRLLLHFLFVAIFCIIKYGILGHHMSLHVTFGDGTPITVQEMFTIRRVIHKNMVFNRWAAGDLLFLDNFSTSHGRQPTYDHSRKVVVAWADPLQKPNLVKSMDVIAKAIPVTPADHRKQSTASPELTPQERSPDTTLTKSDAQVLTAAATHLVTPQQLFANTSEETQTTANSSSVTDPSFWNNKVE